MLLMVKVRTCDQTERETESCLSQQQNAISHYRKRKRVACCHVDVIGESFWEEHIDVIT